MSSRLPPGSAPPYTAVGVFLHLLNLFGKLRPDTINDRWLQINGVSQGTTFALLSTLRYLNIIGESGTVLNQRLLTRLGNPSERPAALKELVDVAYEDLIRQTALEDATIKSVDLYFQYQGNKPSLAGKAARFFIWIAGQAGYKLGEEFRPAPARRMTPTVRKPAEKPNPPQIAFFGTPPEPEPDSESSSDAEEEDGGIEPEVTPYEEELLRILLDKLKASNTMPDTELIREIKGLIELVKGQRP